MLDRISDALISAGYTRADARVRATLVVSGMRGLCQDVLVTANAPVSTRPLKSDERGCGVRCDAGCLV